MSQTSTRFADVEFYADEASAVAALRPSPGETRELKPLLPEWATRGEVEEIEGVTLLRPKDTSIRDNRVRPGLRYGELVQHYGRDRLVLNMTDLRPFGHPFHDDIFTILRELGRVGGRLAICGAGKWYIERLGMNHQYIRVISGPPAPDA